MSAKSIPSSAKTQTAGRSTSTAPKLTARDEFEILASQANDCQRAGIEVGWTELYPGPALALVFPGGRLCPKCHHPYIGPTCWYCAEAAG